MTKKALFVCGIEIQIFHTIGIWLLSMLLFHVWAFSSAIRESMFSRKNPRTDRII